MAGAASGVPKSGRKKFNHFNGKILQGGVRKGTLSLVSVRILTGFGLFKERWPSG